MQYFANLRKHVLCTRCKYDLENADADNALMLMLLNQDQLMGLSIAFCSS